MLADFASPTAAHSNRQRPTATIPSCFGHDDVAPLHLTFMSTARTISINASPVATLDPRAVVSPLASLGRGCTVAAGAVIPAGAVLEDDVSVGPNVVLVEAHLHDGQGSLEHPAWVRTGAKLGANSVVHAGVVIASGVVVRPGSVVTRSVPPAAIVEGNPATIVGYVGASERFKAEARIQGSGQVESVRGTHVAGVTLHRLPMVPDLRGNLTVGEFGIDVPFVPARYFMVFGVPSRETRGEHAHRACHQFLVCVRGSCAVVADDGRRRIEVVLDTLDSGLYLPPMTWGIQYRYTADAVLLVFASHHYDPADYIRDYDAFLAARGAP